MVKLPNRKITPFISQQVPDFVREQYPTFVSFLEAYYEWLHESGNVAERSLNLLTYRDIDTTIDQFLEYFQRQFIPNIPKNVLVNKVFLVKHIKDFYKAKGTEKSYKFLFRILYDEDVEFYYPKVDILKPSDGKWVVEKVIRTTTVHDTLTFAGHKVVGVSSGATANIEKVTQLTIDGNTVSELYLSKISGTFTAGETITVVFPNSVLVEETVYKILTDVEIVDPGYAHSVDEELTVTGDGVGAVVKIEKVGGTESGKVVSATSNTITLKNNTAQFTVEIESGSVSKVRILSGGQRYSEPPVLTFSTGSAEAVAFLDDYGKVTYVSVTNIGADYTEAPTLTATPPVANDYYKNMVITIESGKGSGQSKTIIAYDSTTNVATVNSNWTTTPDETSTYSIVLGKVTKIKIIDFGINYATAPTVSSATNGTFAVKVGTIGSFAGKWTNTDGFISSNKYIQDSYYYQDFSYVLRSNVPVDTYKNIVKQLLHPAGMKMFGELPKA